MDTSSPKDCPTVLVAQSGAWGAAVQLFLTVPDPPGAMCQGGQACAKRDARQTDQGADAESRGSLLYPCTYRQPYCRQAAVRRCALIRSRQAQLG
ncbi:hypothetical protein NDU88_001646 [Pleurodeles waltl]|uniref:Uncharacterized protein n=1 Tax=Pleurodeles waltl TaxID=8319 RepID=A0AAV7WL60_PLEWA|nr:hypothetical protein NDU88_001646 [Pleurodeles waltl]